jgi:hypothetical protein
MATIDIRATVTCSLGTLISGSISDDYIQGSGLVKTRGSVQISGTITPALGTIVTFEYVKDGVTRTLPRKLRVLSSFADPFRRTTDVELGCLLTYLSDLQEPVDWTAFDDPQNTDFTEEDQLLITLPIYASSVMTKCLTELGITATSNPLTNKFSIASFDFGAGYVQVLNDLLVSESYCAYLNTDEVLQVFSLDQDSGTGPVFTADDIVDLGAIGVGQLPGEAVTVSYSTLKLKQPDPQEEIEEENGVDQQAFINWEANITYSSPKSYFIDYKLESGPDKNIQKTKVYTGSEATLTFTDYTRIEYVDEDNRRQVKEVPLTKLTRVAGNAISRLSKIATEYAAKEVSFSNPIIILSETSEVYVYDEFGNQTGYVTRKYEPEAAVLSAVDFDFSYPFTVAEEVEGPPTTIADPSTGNFISSDRGDTIFLPHSSPTYTTVSGTAVIDASYALMQTEEIVNVTENVGSYSRELTSTYLRQALTQNGQQAISTYKEKAGGLTIFEGQALGINILSNPIVHENTTDTVNRTGESKAQERPPVAERTNAAFADGGDPNNGWRTESTADLELALGSATAQRRIEFSLPYAPDDTFYGASGGPYFATASDAPAKANRYGRVQNRLLLGNRNGMNLQLTPERLPSAPFAPLYIEANGLTALFRANGTNWAFDSNGIVCSVDALYWGAVGGEGVFWFPVPPGITALPAAPIVIDGQITTTSVIPPYNETAIYDARLRLTAAVTKFDYSLELLSVIPPLSIRLQSQVYDVTLLNAETSTFAATGQNAALVRRYTLPAATTGFVLSGFGAGSIRDYAIGTNAGTFTTTGQPATLLFNRAPLAAEVGSVTATGQSAELRVIQPLRIDAGAFVVTGQAANFIRIFRLPAGASSFSATGSAANLFAEDYFSRWATQTYGFEELVYPSWWTD